MDPEKVPRLGEVLPGGGKAGLSYAYVLAENINKAKAKGYQLVPRGETFEVADRPVLIMWQGETVTASGALPKLFVDTELAPLF